MAALFITLLVIFLPIALRGLTRILDRDALLWGRSHNRERDWLMRHSRPLQQRAPALVRRRKR